MLFLAVTLGFFVENQREHFVEHQREKKYIRSMIEDLKADTASFKRVTDINAAACKKIDTLISLLKGKDRLASAKKIYFLSRFIPFEDPSLACQNKTFEQMKSSGSLRLISNEEAISEIGNYYQNNKYIESGPTPMQFQNRRDLLTSYDLLFDAGLFHRIIQSMGSAPTDIPESEFVLLSKDSLVINSICMRFHIMYSTKKVVVIDGLDILKRAAALIAFLQKEYDLK